MRKIVTILGLFNLFLKQAFLVKILTKSNIRKWLMKNSSAFSAVFFSILFLMQTSEMTFSANGSQKKSLQQIQYVRQILNNRSELGNCITTTEYPTNWDDFDVTYYQIALKLNPNTLNIIAATQVGIKVIATALSEIALDFSIPSITIEGVGMAATDCTVRNDSLFLKLDRVYFKDETLRVAVSYNGTPQTPINAIVPVFSIFDSGETYPAVFTNNFPNLAHCWFPCRDYPGDKADSADLLIRVPNGLIAASNGLLSEVINHNDGTTTYHWHEGYPISTFVISFAAAHYTTIQDIYVTAKADTVPIINYVFQNAVAKASKAFSFIKPQMEFLEQKWGEYPFSREKYGHAQCDGMNIWGYWPNQTLGNIHTGAIEQEEGLVDMSMMSLLVRQWWGNWVSPANFGHFWLSDGLGAYSASLWAEHVRGPDEYWMWMDYNKSNVILNKNQTVYRSVGEPLLVSATFDKGCWIFHMLRFEYGDSLFFATMQEFGKRFGHGNATTEDFQAVWEEMTKDNLDWFFQQWIYEPGYPILQCDWTNFKLSENLYEMRYRIKQIQDIGPNVFKLPITLEMHFADGIQHSKFFFDSQDTTIKVQTNKPPLDVLLDPDNAILKQTTETEKHFNIINWTLEEVSGNGDKGWDPGEVAKLKLKLYYEGIDAQNANISLKSKGEDILPLSAEVSYNNIADGDTLFSSSQSFEIQASENAQPRNAKLYFNISRGGIQIQIDSIYVPLGDANILFVDDDGGKDYEKYYNQALIRTNNFAKSWDTKTAGIPTIQTSDFPIIIWSTGSERENTLTKEEQSILKDCLNSGGALLLAGQNIGYDLIENGDAKDSLFLANVLMSEFISDSATVPMLLGQTGDPVWQGLFVSFQGKMGTADPTSPDVVKPISPANACLNCAGHPNQHAGIYYYNPQNGSRLIYLTFGLESAKGPYETTQADLLDRCLNWLKSPTSVTKNHLSSKPINFKLHPSYPNPFNPTITICFDSPEQANIKLEIVNILGQVIRVLVDDKFQSGTHFLQWNGDDHLNSEVSSGIYFIKISNGSHTIMQKVLKMK